MAMTITYELDGALYVNFTNRCSNNCTFCLRNNYEGVNGKDSLWLDHEPILEEIIKDFEKRDISKYKSVVFCGYGEPLMRFDTCIKSAKWLKSNHPHIKIRINTNGQANMIEGRDVTPSFEGIIDSISISLNAPTAKQYNELCRSDFGEAAFDGLLDFTNRVKAFVPDVTLSVVDRDLSKEEISACKALADNCGVNFRLRQYIE